MEPWVKLKSKWLKKWVLTQSTKQLFHYNILEILMNTLPHIQSTTINSVILTHLLVLIGCNCNELCLLKYMSTEGTISLLECHWSIISLYHMDPWLVLVHRIQDKLQMTRNNITNLILSCLLCKNALNKIQQVFPSTLNKLKKLFRLAFLLQPQQIWQKCLWAKLTSYVQWRRNRCKPLQNQLYRYKIAIEYNPSLKLFTLRLVVYMCSTAQKIIALGKCLTIFRYWKHKHAPQ